ncbi:MAG: DUF349 domain-containing protein [Hymenobacteraceae bacterium]|nr:DUF349 domain-containing protein [Hymenobacteraceae bacterium]MDX5395877.1 DUF349 domain-containing protein [Hymenobacteraceae bacterium]MDX5444301.1 DUF349 domain-containing protein [Hymenobacteraceae bacterium]MDX5511932.1 DUF349 domain-containing protein [Hymenobacteraceae bacterium]
MENRDYLEDAKKYGYIQDNQVWLKPFLDFPARQVGDVKENEDESLEYFARRFELFREKVDTLIEKISQSENKGSFLMKVLHLKDQVGKYSALGDFTSVYEKLAAAEDEINVAIRKNREKNLATKVALATEAEELQHSIDWKDTSERFKELRQNWIKTGPVDKDVTDEVETRFKEAIENFFKRKKDFFQDKKMMQQRTYDKYNALIAEANAIKDSDDFEATSQRLKQLQQEWKEVGGKLPRKTVNTLWLNFRKANNYFFERLKNRITTNKYQAREKYMDDNLSRKRDLVERAEALLETNLNEATRKAKELQAEWKKVGPVPQPDSDIVWERFIKACDKIFEMSSLEHYMRKRAQLGEDASQEEQVNARINVLKDFIKADRQELEVLEANLGKLSPSPSNEAFRKMLQGKIRNFNRKIGTKQELIERLKNQL